MDGWIVPAVAALVLWGIVGVLQKLGSNRLDASSLLIWVTLGYIVVLPLILWRIVGWGLSPTALLLGLVAGSVNGLGTWLLFHSLERGAKASVAIPLTALYPAVTVILAFIFLAERLSSREWLGVALAVCGGAMLSYEKPRGCDRARARQSRWDRRWPWGTKRAGVRANGRPTQEPQGMIARPRTPRREDIQ
jgi:bacterial/archaeal transporter family protein